MSVVRFFHCFIFHGYVYVLQILAFSVQFSLSVVSNSLWPHESQHTSPSCPSPAPGVHSNSCPSSRWCHPAISFSSCPQSLPASGSFPMSQLLAWGGQSIGVSALASVLAVNTQYPSKNILDLPSQWLDLVERRYRVSLVSMWDISLLTKFKVIFLFLCCCCFLCCFVLLKNENLLLSFPHSCLKFNKKKWSVIKDKFIFLEY